MRKILLLPFLFLSLSAQASSSEGDDFVLKFRGLFNQVNGKLQALPDQYTPAAKATPQSIGKFASNGVGGEVALTMHLNERFAGEVASGVTVYKTKGSTSAALAKAYSTNTQLSKKRDLFTIPTYLTLQYHVAPYGAIRPYIGGGYHYTYMYNKSNQYKVANAGGPVVQLGVNVVFQDDTYINLDVKQYFLKTKVKYNQGFIHSSNNGQISPKMKLDPLSVGLGIGFKL